MPEIIHLSDDPGPAEDVDGIFNDFELGTRQCDADGEECESCQ